MSITASTILQTQFWEFNVSLHEFWEKSCVIFSYGNFKEIWAIVRIQSSCLFWEAFHSLHCDCDRQLKESIQTIRDNWKWVIVYTYAEWRWIGLKDKIRAYETQRVEWIDTQDAFMKLWFWKADFRTYETEILALQELGVNKKIKSFSGNPEKQKALIDGWFEILETLKIEIEWLHELAKNEINTKIEKMWYKY